MGAVHGRSNSDEASRANATLFPAETRARRQGGARRTRAFVARQGAHMVAARQRLPADLPAGIVFRNVLSAGHIARLGAAKAGLVDRVRAVGAGAVVAFVAAPMLPAWKPLQAGERAQVLRRFLVLKAAANGPLGLSAGTGYCNDARTGRARTRVAAFIANVATGKSTATEIATAVWREPGIEFRVFLLSTITKVAIWNCGEFLVAELANR